MIQILPFIVQGLGAYNSDTAVPQFDFRMQFHFHVTSVSDEVLSCGNILSNN